MYRKYIQLSTQFINTFIPSSSSTILNVKWENQLHKRWAGHSKWQNIKSTKQAADHNKSVTFQKLTRVIALAVRESGPDPATNHKLKVLIEDARKVNMPKSTLEKAIKGAQSQTTEKPYWAVFSGPKGIVVGLEVTFANTNAKFLLSKLSSQTKKLRLKMEPYYSHLCNQRGVIITSPLENTENAYDKALEDAIEIGIDEVYENEDKSLIFDCNPDRIDSFSQQLMRKGYNIESSSTELDFKDFVTLQEEEVKDLEKVISNLQSQYEEVVRASYNIAEK